MKRTNSTPVSKNGRQAVESPSTRRTKSSPSKPTTRGKIPNVAPPKSAFEEKSKRPSSKRQSAVSSNAEKNQRALQEAREEQATKNTIKETQGQNPTKQEDSENESETHYWFAIVCFLIAGYILMSLISYMFHYKEDADLATFSTFFTERSEDVMNRCGTMGAIIGDAIIGKWLGIFGFFIPIYLLLLGIRLLKIKTLKFKRSMASSIVLMLTGSITLGHFCGVDSAYFGSGLGGESGIYTAQWLHNIIGYDGTTLLIIFLSFAALYYAFGRSWRHFSVALGNYLEMRKRHKHNKLEQQRLQLLEWEEKNRALSAEIERMRREAAQNQVQEPELPFENPEQEIEDEEEEEIEEQIQQPEPQHIEFNTEPQKSENDTKGNFIALEGGQLGYIMGCDEATGEVIYWYLDLAALYPKTPQSTPTKITVIEKEEEEVEEIFTIREEAPVVKEEVPQKIEFKSEIPLSTEVENPAITENNDVVKFEIEEKHEPQAPIFEAITKPKEDVGFEVEKSGEEEKISDMAINSMPLYDPTAELPKYQKPMVELLQDHTKKVVVSEDELKAKKDSIVNTLLTFGIKISSIKATIGPTVTLYEIVPAPGVRISKIKNLEDDIALALLALGIRIIAPIPGKGTIGIEVPNENKETVSMHSVVTSAKFQDSKAELPIALGKTIQNETFVFDLAKMPHLLVAGATGQGKSVGLNAIITSLLYKKHPSELKFILVDPKKVELTLYAKLEKHFLAKMDGEDEAIITDTQKVIYTLNSLCIEMDARYELLKAAEVRNIVEYNDKFVHRRLNPEKGHRFLPYFVVIIDEFADLIMTAGREVETPIARIAQLARAVGIHLIIATQRPTTNIITGVIKANFPARIAFKVTSMIDSRTILDTPGANQLIGRGDMLISTGSEITRVQCAFIDTPEVDSIARFISDQRGYVSAYELPEYVPESENGAVKDVDMTRKDPLFDEVARHVVASQTGSASTIQRKFAIGFNRAGRIVDQLEAAGIVGAQSGSKAREVLIKDPLTLEGILEF